MPSKSRRTDEGIVYTVPIKTEEELPTEEVLFFRKVKSKTKPYFELTPAGADRITEMAAEGCKIEDIAEDIGLSKQTLYSQHNREILDRALKKGQSKFRNRIRHFQYVQAEGGSTTAAIWLGKQYLGQSDNPPPTLVPVSPIPDFVDKLVEAMKGVKKDDRAHGSVRPALRL